MDCAGSYKVLTIDSEVIIILLSFFVWYNQYQLDESTPSYCQHCRGTMLEEG